MKKLLFALIAVSVCAFSDSACAQTINKESRVFQVGTSTDTAFGNSTKYQRSTISPGGTISLQYKLEQINDSCAGYASVWCSIDGITYCPWPGADSVQITVGVDVRKMWFLATSSATNQVKFLEVRTRLTSTYTVGKAKVKTKVFPF
jgi:hypothetical protein